MNAVGLIQLVLLVNVCTSTGAVLPRMTGLPLVLNRVQPRPSVQDTDSPAARVIVSSVINIEPSVCRNVKIFAVLACVLNTLINFAFRSVLAAGAARIVVVATDVMDAVLVFPGVKVVPL
jgi:hypothetical protein